MIQRIQTIWYLLAAVVTGLVFTFDIYQATGNVVSNLTIGNDVVAIIIAAVAILLDLYTLILFKNRKRQITFNYLSIIATLSLFAYLYVSIDWRKEAVNIVDGHYWIGLFLPLISFVFLVLGLLGVKKDEKLIKSLDRLR